MYCIEMFGLLSFWPQAQDSLELGAWSRERLAWLLRLIVLSTFAAGA